jgi:hypothetical protein
LNTVRRKGNLIVVLRYILSLVEITVDVLGVKRIGSISLGIRSRMMRMQIERSDIYGRRSL